MVKFLKNWLNLISKNKFVNQHPQLLVNLRLQYNLKKYFQKYTMIFEFFEIKPFENYLLYSSQICWQSLYLAVWTEITFLKKLIDKFYDVQLFDTILNM